jgi:hypothetical protein
MQAPKAAVIIPVFSAVFSAVLRMVVSGKVSSGRFPTLHLPRPWQGLCQWRNSLDLTDPDHARPAGLARWAGERHAESA